MSLRDLNLAGYLDHLGARTPAPGGGAAACTTGATAAAITKMVVEYSLGKKNLAEHQPALERAAATLSRLAAMFLELADEDAAAYGLVNELSRLPETDERRVREYPAAAAAAVAIPRAALAAACDLLRLVESLAPITNRHLRSDLAIGGILAESAARAAWWNVQVNLSLIPDPADRAAIEHESRAELNRAATQRTAIEHACA